MHAGRNYTLKQVLIWTRRYIYKFLAISIIPVLLYELLAIQWLAIPWLPMALVGTAVAFLIGFKNNASYERQWEARKIWGAIVNASRSWGIMVMDFVTNEHAVEAIPETELYQIKRQLIYRHIAWLTALRHQLRTKRAWENHEVKSDAEYRKRFPVAETLSKLEDDISFYLIQKEKDYIMGKSNPAAHLVSLQSKHLKDLKFKGLIEDFRHMEMENMLVEFYTQQGKNERIKNFPYPRQYATVNRYFVWLFIVLLPLGMISEFAEMGAHFVWLTVPFSTLVSWVFHTMERIGDASENPFEGSPNDIPITALSRTIEIDLREMLDETELPEKMEPVNDILM
ncbi:bestrophin family ion channel [Fulvivirgaceae bacterium BMA12]|uniref:Bestrophin family ion channel n=1 Tax=Agaribacillus aureus TaxID=3051825 RepID=A0ABT8LI02_9BACT|nr:bestrophin family ion channel [Fulvivirgaceae bacterium BMA12]